MKGVILTGGTGTRLAPLTKVTNKCLLPVGQTPMIYRMIDLLTLSNIHDIMLITGPEHMGQVVSLLGSGAEKNCSMTYRIQDSANGIAAALNLCKNFCGEEKFAVILGDNIFSDHSKISESIKEFSDSNDDFRLFAKEVPDPQRFGVPIYENGKVVDIIEKPKNPPSSQAIVGLYCYSKDAFDVIKNLKPSSRGEYEISDVNSWYVKNKLGRVIELTCGWVDAGTHDSYRKANEMIWSSL
jgi:glucose-1-phosphate thymidylyltransferase